MSLSDKISYMSSDSKEYDFENKCFIVPKPNITIEQLNRWWKRKGTMCYVSRIFNPYFNTDPGLKICIDGSYFYRSLDDLLKDWEPISDEEVLRIVNNLGRA